MPSERATRASRATAPARRRSWEEIHRLLLDAASELFATKGYAGTTTRAIAARAGVSEVMLYRHYDSKARLFSEAILGPFNEFLREFAQTWGAHADESERDQEFMRAFVSGLYDLAQQRRRLLVDLLSAAEYEPTILATSGDGGPLLDGMADVVQVGSGVLERRGFRDDALEMSTAAIIGMIIASVVFGPLLLDEQTLADSDAVIDVLARINGETIEARKRRP